MSLKNSNKFLIVITSIGTLATVIILIFVYFQLSNKILVDKTEYEQLIKSKTKESQKDNQTETKYYLIMKWHDYLKKYSNEQTEILVFSKRRDGISKKIQGDLNSIKISNQTVPIYSPDKYASIPENVLVKYFSVNDEDFSKAIALYLSNINKIKVDFQYQDKEEENPNSFEIWINIK